MRSGGPEDQAYPQECMLMTRRERIPRRDVGRSRWTMATFGILRGHSVKMEECSGEYLAGPSRCRRSITDPHTVHI